MDSKIVKDSWDVNIVSEKSLFIFILDDNSYLLSQIENQIYIENSRLSDYEISNL